MKKIAIFASGSGSNMQKIAEYFTAHPEEEISIACVITDQKEAYVLQRAKALGIPSHYLTREELGSAAYLLRLLKRYGVCAIVLAGYLRLVPVFLLNAFPDRIVNIHPALLPKYGGKGMYGMNVHRAVWEAREKTSGITIHLVDDRYDKGSTLFQASTPLSPTDSPEEIQKKVQVLEHQYFAPTIAKWLKSID